MNHINQDKGNWGISEMAKNILGNISRIEMGQSPDSVFYNEGEIGLPLIQGNADIKERKSIKRIWTSKPTKVCEAGDILMTVRAPVGFIGIATYSSCIGRGVCAIKATEVDEKYLYYLLISQEENWKAFEQGSTFTAVGSKEVFNFPLSIINSKSEQIQIARILSTADAVIEKTQAAIAKYKAIKQGMLHDLFTRGIDITTGKLRPSYEDAPELYKESKLGWIPKEWEVEKIGNFAFVTKLAGFEYTLYFDYSKSGPIIAVRALNIKQGKLELANVHTIPKETSDILPRSQLKNGDLVISYVGTVGEVAVIPEDNKFHLAPNVAKITVEKKEINPFYMNQFLNADIGQNEIIKMVSSTTQAALSMQNLREVKFIKPKMDEQILIKNKLNGIDNKLRTEQTYLHKIQQIKQGLMSDLLSGRKSVKTQDVASHPVKTQDVASHPVKTQDVASHPVKTQDVASLKR